MKDADTRYLLGSFIRAHRERMPSPTNGIGRRRTPGWRREELAEACGVGVTWITWLEQGRDVSASAATLSRLAEALHLTVAERASLFDLAGKLDPAIPDPPSTDLPASLLALPSLFAGPAYLLDHGWDARAWNAAAAKLFTGWLEEGRDPNLLRFVFLSSTAKELIMDWEERTRRLIAEFRADYNRRPRDPSMRALLEDLMSKSGHFSQLWEAQSVLHREGGERRFYQPAAGEMRFVQTTLLFASHPECKLVCLAPVA